MAVKKVPQQRSQCLRALATKICILDASRGAKNIFKATPHNGARRFGQCFDPSESMENAGILDVFPIFHTARLGQKIRRSPQLPLCGVALRELW